VNSQSRTYGFEDQDDRFEIGDSGWQYREPPGGNRVSPPPPVMPRPLGRARIRAYILRKGQRPRMRARLLSRRLPL
jgi:hypothetical protein